MESTDNNRPLYQSQRFAQSPQCLKRSVRRRNLTGPALGNVASTHGPEAQGRYNCSLRHWCSVLHPILPSSHAPSELSPQSKGNKANRISHASSAVIASIFRLVYISRFPHTSDFTYLYSQIALCRYVVAPNQIPRKRVADTSFCPSLAEIAIIILCTCFPMMPRFTHLILDRLDSSRTGSSDHSRFNNRTYHSSGKRRVKLRGSSGSKHWESGDEGLSQLQNIYAPIMDSGSKNKDAQDGGAVDGMRGIKKTVRIELISQNRSEGGDIVESVVV